MENMWATSLVAHSHMMDKETDMLDKYQPNFASLTPQEATMVAVAVARRHPDTIGPMGMCSPSGAVLYTHCVEAGLGQVDVVLSMASDPSAEAVVVLEKLVGRPITRSLPKPVGESAAPTVPRAPREAPSRGAAVRRTDPRKIVYVAANPKKPGSASHTRFALYQVGMTLDQFIAAGGTSADVKWDLERGFIKLEGE